MFGSVFDRKLIAGLLNGGELPWIEFYSSRLDYEKVAQNKSDRAALDGSVKEDQIELLKSAKPRYILYNQARQKNNGQLMKRLADILAIATRGIVADYKRPVR